MTPSRQQERAPARHHVHIRPDGIKREGNQFSYAHADGQDAASITVRRGDHVKWRCDHGNFSILFKNHSPFGEIAFHGRRGHETAEALVVGESGSYHYAVTVSADAGLVVDDPEVIVNNGN